jgi:hypothetical protein
VKINLKHYLYALLICKNHFYLNNLILEFFSKNSHSEKKTTYNRHTNKKKHKKMFHCIKKCKYIDRI